MYSTDVVVGMMVTVVTVQLQFVAPVITTAEIRRMDSDFFVRGWMEGACLY